VLAVVVGGLLLLGVVRTVLRLRGRREAKKASEAAMPPGDEAVADAAPPGTDEQPASATHPDAEDGS